MGGLATLELVSGQARWNIFSANNAINDTPFKVGPPTPPTNPAGRQAVNNPRPTSPWAKLFTGIVGGMAQQLIGMCPNMCETILDQVNTINPDIVNMVEQSSPVQTFAVLPIISLTAESA